MSDLTALIPAIRRARGWRLYTENGRRLLDFCQDQGRGVMGWKADGATRLAKALMDKALTAPYPSVWQKRLEKAVLAWKPAYTSVLVFDNETEAEQVFKTLSDLRGGVLNDVVPFAALEMPFAEFLPDNEPDSGFSGNGKKLAIARLPLARSLAPGILLLSKTAFQELEACGKLPPQRPVAAFKLGAAVKSLQSLAAFQGKYRQALWAEIDPFIENLFSRRGPWLFPVYPAPEHRSVFQDCLASGILISPAYDFPSLIPGEFDLGEIKVLADIVRPRQ